jgi:hydroxymethylpyrimidine/phosphomethylpyrimidine kinase
MKVKIGNTIVFKTPGKDRRSGDTLVKGMRGKVRRVMPANETIYPDGGDQIEAVFMSGYGCAFSAWVAAPEIEVVCHD